MGSDAELIAHQPIEDLHDVLMRNERMVIPQTCFCCLFKPLGQEASLLSGMYPLLEQAVPTWLNRMFLPGSNKNHNSNGLGDTLHHTPRSRMVESPGRSAQPRNQRYFCFSPDLSELMKNVPKAGSPQSSALQKSRPHNEGCIHFVAAVIKYQQLKQTLSHCFGG